ncbi:MAG: hypothetical protein A3D95_02180 [Betaproteobacteria bacterium RIFCSPHIGHO2_12_FULL_69_13]|nr:MAG: hypothetical protein A3D95_02180 [Betaproteobacteria bacterium RIFCSPHIGHO2_12_FULL_69_13]OGA70316.1 MAG: hypothetical protein A3G83_06090 [Betaproteobacteria bacterium RIFCSPLOWO2_12_FULL_68_20]
MIPFSVLDLAPIVEGGDAAQALKNSLDLARHAERWGYRRVWLAEHHNMPGIASSATAVAIAHVAGGTQTIRVGAGGIMLPNHAPLVIAEQFGTLESLFPGRIDLALGRAPGTDQLTARALRYDAQAADAFPDEVLELMHYFQPVEPGQRVRAVPGAGLDVPIWILGSSLYGAQLAAALGLPYAFASHFAPAMMMQALEVYRARFRPSGVLERPYAMLGVNVFAAETGKEARRLMSSRLQSTIALRLGRPGPLPPPVDDFESRLGPMERALVAELVAGTVVGTPDEVRAGLEAFIEKTAADELIVAAQVYDHAARLRCYEIAAQARDELSRSRAAPPRTAASRSAG